MPQIIFKGVEKKDVNKVSEILPKFLSEVTNTPIDYFIIERPETVYYFGGYPLIEVIQFDRGKDIEKKIAKIISDEVKKCGYKECEVYFTHIEKENYYE